MENTRKFTRNLMAKFPSWMKMSKDPDSVGAKFLDVFGLTFQEFEEEMNYVVQNFYVETADIEMVDILYRIPLTEEVVTDFTKGNEPKITIHDQDGYVEDVGNVFSVRHLYDRNASLPIALVNREDGYLYLRVDFETIDDREQPFQYIEIEDARHYSVEFHHVWNAFDEFAFMLGLNRLQLETNEELKERILDVFRNPGSNTHEGIKNGLTRELSLDNDEVDVFTLNESIYDRELVRPDGSPTKKMREYAKNINSNLKFTVDTLNLGEAYWYSIEEDNIGIYFLPHIWDVDESLFETEEFQSGVGFDDDLLVKKPLAGESTQREFVLNVSLVGYYEDFEEFYPEVSFEYKIYAEGKLLENSYEEEPFRYTTVATEAFQQEYAAIASQEFMYLHRVLFENKNLFADTTEADFIHFGESNEFLNSQTDNLLRLSMYLTTTNEYQSNQMEGLRVWWEDTDGGEHSYTFDTRDKWIMPQSNSGGQPSSTVVTSGTYFNEEDNALELGRGNFNEEVKTTSDFMRGRYDTNFVLAKDGKLTLNFDSINQLMD